MISRPSLRKGFVLSQSEIDAFMLAAEATEDVPVVDDVTVEVRDPYDVPVLATALAGNAGYLVTGDDDLLSLAGDPRLGNLRIVRPRAFLDILISDD